jgi:imidazolonepropionase-like amidohydrolase
MKYTVVAALAVAAGFAVGAQDLVITNARILDFDTDIARGSIVIESGRIVQVAAGSVRANGKPRLDAGGRTVLPGYIDAHRHIINGDQDKWFREESVPRMREFLEAGYTTLMSGGGPMPGIMELKRRVDSGELESPRVITSGRADPANFKTEAEARAAVQALAAAGVEIVKAATTPADKAMLTAIVDEARKHDLEVMVHAVTGPAMLAAIEAGAGKLVHTPHDSFLTNEQAKLVADHGIENLSTVGFAVPLFNVFNHDNVPTFRDGSPWPSGILGTGANAAGEKPVNGRILWDNGVVYGFGTDTNYLPIDGLYHELKTLNLVFSPLDVLKLMGPNTAAFIDKQNELGTIDAGKIADLTIVDGDPLKLIFNLMNIAVVVQNGKIVVDHR